MEYQKKNFVGSAKQIDGKYWAFFSLSINADKLQEIKNEKGYARLTMSLNKEPDKYGNTHSVIEDTWKPKPKTDNFWADFPSSPF